MKKSKAMQIANVWNELHAGYTEETKTVAEAVKHDVKDWHVEIRPTGINTGNAFFQIEELAAIKATFRASVFVMQSVCEGTEVLIAYIYIEIMAAKEFTREQKGFIEMLNSVRESIGRKLGTEGYVVAGFGGDTLYAYIGEGKGYKGAALTPVSINPVIFNTSKAAQRVASDGVYENGNGNVIALEVVEAASYFNGLYNRATQIIEQAEELFNKQ